MLCERCRCQIRQAPITPMQRAVLHWVVRGMSDSEIAEKLNRGLGTIKIHCAKLRAHFGVRNRTELAVAGVRYIETQPAEVITGSQSAGQSPSFSSPA